MSPCETLTLNITNQSFCVELWLMMMHHYTKFTYKIFGDSDDILQTNILDILTFTVTLALNAVLQHFHKTLWLMMMYHQTKCGWKRISDTEDVVETVIF